MLGKELNSLKQSLHSKSSILHEDMDEKKLIGLIEDKDRTIRKLTKKIEKLEQTLKRTNLSKNIPNSNSEQTSGDNVHYQLLKAQVEKTKMLEEIIDDITDRVNSILEGLSQDNTFTDNSEEIKEMLRMIDISRNQSVSSDFLQNQLQRSLNISSEWTKKIDLLEGAFKSFKNKFQASAQSNKSLAENNDELKRKVSLLEKKQDSEEVKMLINELKEEKKQRQKLKKLLEKSQHEKNELINKINLSGMKEADVRAKTKEQLLQYSKELHYRVRDLQKEKESLLKEATKDKEEDLKKYQTFLKKLKIIKEKSFIGKSCA